jgi:PAS domain S-box-containing protein
MVFLNAFLEKLGLKQVLSKTHGNSKLADYQKYLADRSEDGIAVIGIEGTINFVNGACTKMLGYINRDELVGKNIKQFYAGKAADEFSRFISQTKRLNWYIGAIEQSRWNGASFPAQLKMVALKNDSGKLTGILLIMEDLSRISQTQKEIQRTACEMETLKTRLRQFEEKLARRNQLVAVVDKNDEESGEGQPALSVPIGEIRQLAEMAKRFR